MISHPGSNLAARVGTDGRLLIFKVFTPILAACYAAYGPAVQASQHSPDVANGVEVSLEFDDDLLSIDARDATLVSLLAEIGRQAGFEVVLVDDFDDRRPLSLNLRKMPLERVLRRLLRDTSNMIFHAEGGRGIAQVWLLGSGPVEPRAPPVIENDDVETSELPDKTGDRARTVLRLANHAEAARASQIFKQIEETLTWVVTGDQDALVRSRAAMALGKLGTDGAITALALATRDIDASVRAQAIVALGGIDSMPATRMLGDILMDVSRPSSSRIIAARMLWRHDRDLARSYLESAANDSDDSVRQAAAEPPPSAANNVESDRRGTFELE